MKQKNLITICVLTASHFKRESVKSTHFGIQSVRHLGPKIWNIVPQNIREVNSINEFKSLSFGNLVLALVGIAKTSLLKWILYDLICIETICVSFTNLYIYTYIHTYIYVYIYIYIYIYKHQKTTINYQNAFRIS